MLYHLRDYQQSAVDAACAFIKYRSGNGYITAAGGSGKSIKIAKVAEFLVSIGKRVVILARSERLLTQNRDKLAPEYRAQAGIYCAGLGEKDASKPITIASIQSICDAPADVIGQFDFALVDECDEIHPDPQSDTQYWRFFRACGTPRIIGFTATPFRTQSGLITWGEEIISIPIAPLFERGYIVPPVNKVGAQLDLSAIPINIGDYAQDRLNTLYTEPELLHISVEKIIQYSTTRNCNLVFTQSLAHADLLASVLESNGEICTVVSGDTDKDELNDYILPAHEAGEFKHLLTCDLLAVGYDMPWIDMVTILKATKSKRKFEQMVYRGTRTYENKQSGIVKRDFLLLDMGNNLQEHGALGSPYKQKSSKQERAALQGKICPACETWVKPLVMQCVDCGHEFPPAEPPKVNHERDVDTYSSTVYSGDICTYDVRGVTYKKHTSRKSKNESLMVSYYCDYGKYGAIAEWLSPKHTSDWARGKAAQFFKDRGNELGAPIESYSWDDLLWHADRLNKPSRITVDHSGEFPRITKYEWGWNEPIEEEKAPPEPKTISELLDGDSIEF